MTNNGEESEEESLDARTRKLLDQRQRYHEELVSIYDSFITWHIGLGKVHIVRRVGPNGIALVFVFWNLLAGVAGIVITLTLKDSNGLGVALIVGSLFGFGSFVAQFWSQAMDYQREFVDKAWGERNMKRMRTVIADLTKVERELDKRLGE